VSHAGRTTDETLSVCGPLDPQDSGDTLEFVPLAKGDKLVSGNRVQSDNNEEI
jgi:hypothetical protein